MKKWGPAEPSFRLCGERGSPGTSELWPQAEAKDVKEATT